jgi:hypothetical protein
MNRSIYYIETDQLRIKHLWIEQYLKGVIMSKQGIQIIINERPEALKEVVPVVIVDNGLFEAAGICFSNDEWEAFTKPDDDRRKKYMLVPKAEIIKHNPKYEGIFTW